MIVTLKTFTGEFPRTQPQLLPDNAATVAVDCDFTRGNLVGIRERTPVIGFATPAGVKSMFAYDGIASSMFAWTRDVDAVRSPVPADKFNRFYWTDAAGFWVSRGDVGGNGAEPSATNKYRVGCPTPISSVAISELNFALPEGLTLAYSLFCEAADGTVSAETALGSPVVTASTSAWQGVWAAGLSCPVAAEATKTTPKVVATTPTLKLTLTPKGGGPVYAILRLSGVHTIPTDYAGYSFAFACAAGATTLTISAKSEVKEFRAYSYSYVNQYGEESGLATPATVDLAEGQAASISYPAYANAEGYCPISKIRLYRTAAGSGGADYLFVAEKAFNQHGGTITDDVAGDALGAPSQSAGFEAPPLNLQGICVMGNGILAGFCGTDLYFMEPYLPYAYRPSTIKPLPHRIVGICPTDDGLYVTTTVHPYLIAGVSPDTMTDRRIPAVQAGVSKGSICSVGATVAYASHDGIVMLRGIDASLDMSFNFFTRDTWRDRYANKLHLMRLNAHDGNIVVWFEDGTPGFLIRTEDGAVSLTKLLDPIYAAFTYPLADALYVAQGSTVYEFKAGGATKAFKWVSKQINLPKPSNFGCIQFVGKGDITFVVSADGKVRHTQTVKLVNDDSNVFRLPSGFLARNWSLQVSGVGNAWVTELSVATSPSGLQNV